MSWQDLISLSLIEIVGDTGLKWFANDGGIANLSMGIFGYVGVVYYLIRNLQGSSLIIVNTAWDGLSTLIETSYALIVLGERYEHWIQYVGLIFIIVGLVFLKIPIHNIKPFKWPTLRKLMTPAPNSK